MMRGNKARLLLQLGLLVLGAALLCAPLAGEWITVPAAAFRPEGQNGALVLSSDFFHQTSLGMVTTDNQVGACLVAPVPLPDGAVVSSIRAVVFDSASDETINTTFRVHAAGGGGLVPGGVTLSSLGSSGVQILSAPLDLVVDNVDRIYFARIASPTSCIVSTQLGLFAVQFEVTRPAIFADGFESGNVSAWN